MADTLRAVVPGEASETDSEDEVIQPALNVKGGAVVSGEASETDSDNDEPQARKDKGMEKLSVPGDIPPLKVEKAADGSPSPDTVSVSSLPLSTREGLGAPKYDTLIHHKLRDKNAALLISIHEAVGGALSEASRPIYAANQLMNKSQVVVQDVCQLIRNFCKDLDLVTQRLDVINSTQYIPNIRIPSASPANDVDMDPT